MSTTWRLAITISRSWSRTGMGRTERPRRLSLFRCRRQPGPLRAPDLTRTPWALGSASSPWLLSGWLRLGTTSGPAIAVCSGRDLPQLTPPTRGRYPPHFLPLFFYYIQPDFSFLIIPYLHVPV